MSTKTSPVVREGQSFIEAARRAQILEAAVETIADLGFANASLAQIAKRAGISKSVIGYYFPSKDDLVRAVVDNFFMTGHEEMMPHLKSATSATELLRAYVRQNILYVAANRQAVRAVGDIINNFLVSDGGTSSGERVFKLEDSEPMVAGTAAMFEWGQQTGEFRDFDTRVMAQMLRGSMDAFTLILTTYTDLDVEHYIQEIADLYVNAACKTR